MADLLDTTGLICPLPVLRLRKRLLSLAPGALLRVRSDDPVAAIDIPHFCAENGHRVLSTRDDGGAMEFLVERGADRPPARD